MTSDTWIKAQDGAVTLNVRVQPKSSREAVLGIIENELKIALKAPPVEGAANAALCAFLAKLLKCPKSAVELIGGQQNRSKRVKLQGVSLDDARIKLESLLKNA